MDYAIEVRTLRPQPVAGIRAVTRTEDIGPTLAQLLPEVLDYLERQGVQPAGPPYNRYHGTRADGIELEVGFPVPTPVRGEGRVHASELPSGNAAVTVHRGPYLQLRDAYRALGLWLKAQHREMAGAPWELYWTGPGEQPDPGQWRTEVFWPIQGKAQ